MPFGGLLTIGLIGAGSSIFSGAMGASAAKTAANQQVTAENNALNFQEQMWNQEQANLAPYISMGNTSMASLMKALQSGQFGAGSIPNMPTFNGTFTAPTLQDAQNSPGYQFTAQQGSKSVLEGAAAAGGAISGGTLKALDQYNTNLANTTYNDVFNRSLQTYQTGLSAYNANLAGYQQNLANQAQAFNEMYAPVQLGENAVAGLNNTGQAVATNVGNLMGSIGNAQASGTVGSTNAITSGVTGSTNSLLQSILLGKMLGQGSSSSNIPTFDLNTASLMGLSGPNTPTTIPQTTVPISYPEISYDFTGLG